MLAALLQVYVCGGVILALVAALVVGVLGRSEFDNLPDLLQELIDHRDGLRYIGVCLLIWPLTLMAGLAFGLTHLGMTANPPTPRGTP